MRKFLKCMLVIAIVAILAVLAYGAWNYYSDNGKTNAKPEDKQVINSQSNTNSVEKKGDEEIKPKDEQTPPDPIDDNKQGEKVIEESNISDDDKALEMAKKEYGTTDGVYFRIEQIQSNSVYIISVRDNQTTRDLAWYTVDVRNGTIK